MLYVVLASENSGGGHIRTIRARTINDRLEAAALAFSLLCCIHHEDASMCDDSIWSTGGFQLFA